MRPAIDCSPVVSLRMARAPPAAVSVHPPALSIASRSQRAGPMMSLVAVGIRGAARLPHCVHMDQRCQTP